MKKFTPLFTLLFIFSLAVSHAQMEIDGQTLYGHEWIDYDQDYYKIKVSEDAIYRVTGDKLQSAGIPIGSIRGEELQLFLYGKEVAITTSTEGSFGVDDYIEFYGEYNRGEIEKHLYEDWETMQLNDQYSMFTEENNYFLTWAPGTSNNERIETLDNDLTGSLPSRERYYMHEELIISNNYHYAPPLDKEKARYSSFQHCEGYGTDLSTFTEIEVNTSNYYPDGDQPYLKSRVGSNYIASNGGVPFHKFELSFNDEIYYRDTFNGLEVRSYQFDIDKNNISTNNSFFVKTRGTSGELKDNNIVAHTTVVYPRELDADNTNVFEFYVAASSNEKYFELTQFDNGSKTHVFDVTNNLRLRAEISGNEARFILPPSNQKRKLIVVNGQSGINISARVEVAEKFKKFEDVDPEYLFITSSELRSGNGIHAYEDFRNSSLGSSYETYKVNYETLRDQFGYGIEGNPIAIRNFANYIKDIWDKNEFVFIVGKALEYSVVRDGHNSPFKNHVPTMGAPGSDNLLFAAPGQPYPFWSVGRLAANTDNDVEIYLDKMIAYEEGKNNSPQTIEDQAWKKKIIHLAGGEADLAPRLLDHLGDMEDIIKDGTMSAEVKTYQKVSNSPTQNPLSENIVNEVNAGVAIMTFFGHSSAGTFDFSIEDPSLYENGSKMPFIISLGCHSGNIHAPIHNPLGISEKFILEPEKAAIAFLASSGAAYIDPQYKGGLRLYDNLGEKFYGKPIGESVKDAVKENFDAASSFLLYRTESLSEQLTLHGDPAIVLPFNEGPDYIVDFESFNSIPDVVSTNLDSFQINFDIVNLGKNRAAILECQIIHSYGNSSDTTSWDVTAPSIRGNYSVSLPTKGINSIGKNTVEIILDYKNKIDEMPNPLAENNNSIKAAYGEEGFSFFVFDNSAKPIYPDEFAIVNEQGVRLIASASNALLPRGEYFFEMDTTENFDSPFKQTQKVESGAGMIDWTPDVSYQDEVVYYWRIGAADADDPNVIIWENSSFIYLENSSTGWNQSHFYQWNKDDFVTAQINDNTRVFEFADNLKSIDITNGVWPEVTPNAVFGNEGNAFIEWNAPVKQGIWIFVLDEFSGEPWVNGYPAQYGSTMNTDWAGKFKAFPYWTRTQDERKPAIDFLQDVIPNKSYVIVMTIQEDGKGYDPSEWGDDPGVNLKNFLEGQGAQRLDDLANNGSVPYVFAFRKNDSSFDVVEKVGTLDAPLTMNLEIQARWFEGSMETGPIGLAKKWNSVEFEMGDVGSSDEYKVSLIGVTTSGQDSVIYDEISSSPLDISDISSNVFPFLKLRFTASDESERSAPYLNYWRINYQGLPDAVLNTNENFVFESDTLGKGSEFILKALVENYTNVDMDSMKMRYTLVDVANQEEIIQNKIAPLVGGIKVPIEYRKSTQNLSGLYELRLEINPDKNQRELHYFNNLGVLRFFVRDDALNPILDVTFDGIHILNGDIVSPSPLIGVSLTDRGNITLDNVDDFELKLQYPDGTIQPIDVNGPLVSFFPADPGGENVARLEFSPTLETGDYILFVQAKDKSGNFSGDQDLSYEFKVIAESQVSEVLNYPNPFSTSTQFVFTLTGSVIPEEFNIRIMTLSGKVVREIRKEELGPLNIGVNRTSFKWDGTDEFGSKLANGVYLYKAFTSFDDLNNSEFEVEALDQYYKKGFGKLVIIR